MSTYTADLKDANSNSIRPMTDWSAIQNVPDFASQIKAVQDIANGKIDKGAAVEYNKAQIDGTTDWNGIVEEGLHVVWHNNGVNAGTHYPGLKNAAGTDGGWGFMLQIGHTNATGLGVQVAFLVPGDIFIRSYAGDNGGSWTDWRKVTYTAAP